MYVHINIYIGELNAKKNKNDIKIIAILSKIKKNKIKGNAT